MKQVPILVLDFGSQYTQLIARKLRESGVYTEVVPYRESLEDIKARNPQGIILSGGPASVYAEDAYKPDEGVWDLGLPILGICYGMQLITQHFGGEVVAADHHEYGKAKLKIENDSTIFKGIADDSIVWMSHGDKAERLPDGFDIIGTSENSPYAAIADDNRKVYAFQFHPEVNHTINGQKILRNFIIDICQAQQNWKIDDWIEGAIINIQKEVGEKHIILGLSGGVDSSVVALLPKKAVGDKVHPIFVNNGVLRKNEVEQVCDWFQNQLKFQNFHYVDAEDEFLEALKGIEDPEEKRKVIGNEFIKVFEEEKHKLENVKYLAQGTIYPDVIESTSIKGPSETIKSHHNVGGLPEELDFELLEPLRELFKDEVRQVGLNLGIPKEMIMRHPFPGPGLGIRILGEISDEKVKILQEADDIFIDELIKEQLYDKVSQAFVVLLPIKSVGVMGDTRTYEYVAAVRSADTVDFMTATFSRLPFEFLDKVASRIINEVKGINRVVYDITSKPPGTIEWE